ncbi:unnamed protein product, partial [Phaeothamnion confervicola]
DFCEEENEYVLLADLPGVSADDVNIEMDDDAGVLNITVERKPAASEEVAIYHFQERRQGQMHRRVQLPADLDGARVESVFRQGVLRLTFPKVEKKRTIKIQEGGVGSGTSTAGGGGGGAKSQAEEGSAKPQAEGS